jgi:hypothetical protein
MTIRFSFFVSMFSVSALFVILWTSASPTGRPISPCILITDVNSNPRASIKKIRTSVQTVFIYFSRTAFSLNVGYHN